MTILDTTLHCADCGTAMPYQLHVLIDVTIDAREMGLEPDILCHNCGLKEMENEL